jgi:hypothetical protein
MWRTRVPAENCAGSQAPERAGPGRIWSYPNGVCAGPGRAGEVTVPSSSRARLLGALLAYGQDNRYGTGADRLESCGCRLLEAASRRL